MRIVTTVVIVRVDPALATLLRQLDYIDAHVCNSLRPRATTSVNLLPLLDDEQDTIDHPAINTPSVKRGHRWGIDYHVSEFRRYGG